MSVRVGIAGLGYWGPNLARNLHAMEGCELAWCCDTEEARRKEWLAEYPEASFTTDLEEMLLDTSLDAVMVSTPVPTHAQVAERVLRAGKHCFVEKPLAQDVASAERVLAAAEESGLVLMVGHLLCYHPGVRRLAELIASGDLGEIYYLYGQRLNLGKLRADENALWSLGAHDVSVLLDLAGEAPSEVWSRGRAFVREDVEDVVFAYLQFPGGLAAHLHLSWLDPQKERRLTVVGSERMAVFDDMQESKLKVYDKGFDPDEHVYGEYVARSGSVWSPPVAGDEPLRLECEHFVECARTGARPRTDGTAGLEVVQVLEALQSSLEADGAPRQLGVPSGT